jgi:hypothetical protein
LRRENYPDRAAVQVRSGALWGRRERGVVQKKSLGIGDGALWTERAIGERLSDLNDEPKVPDPDAVEIPITGELDLHTFRPSDIGGLLPDYFDECRRAGIFSVRVVHGKGTGTLREGVHRLLATLPGVASYRLAGSGSGGWGATWVELEPHLNDARE